MDKNLIPTDHGVSLGSGAPDLWFTLLKSIGMLCIVLAILIAVLFLIKRFSGNKGNYVGRNHIKILSNYYITQRERVVLLDVLGEKILIGVTAQQISFLTKIEKEVKDLILDDKPQESFIDLLKGAIKKK